MHDLDLSLAEVPSSNRLLLLLTGSTGHWVVCPATYSCHSHVQYSVFGSILTIGAMLGAIVSGTVADRVGRRCVSVDPNSILLIELAAPPHFGMCQRQTASREIIHMISSSPVLHWALKDNVVLDFFVLCARRQWQYQIFSAFLDTS